MLTIPGYTIWEQLRGKAERQVYRGSRARDGRAVVIKAYRVTEPGGPDPATRELELLQRVGGDMVPRPLEVVAAGDVRALVLERSVGSPLSHYVGTQALSTGEFLWIALGLARAVAGVHDARIIHKDMKPRNVLVDPMEMRTCLLDFRISAEYGRAEAAAPPETAEGTMHYIAPEQTGRLGVGIDFRADLYSLGATLYELLTGRPPFAEQSGLDLIYAHLAIRPRLVVERERRVPVAISRIVDKLLEKDAELRYQTARGLAADLELCQKQLQREGEIDPELRLGGEDASDRLRFPSKLYGRQTETRELLAALDRVVEGGLEWVLLAGPAGIGKSSLVNVLREPVVRAGGYLAEAKFDPDRSERPYAGFATAFDELISQILAGGPDRISSWSRLLRHEIGSIGAVLGELVPSLRHVVDDFPGVPRVGIAEERERLALAVCRFVRAVARPAHPLVLLLDDLQWADAGSVGLLSAILRGGSAESLLVVGGYRDDEVGSEHALMGLVADVKARDVPVRTLHLEPLGIEHSTAMLADALGRSPDDTAGLAHRIGLWSQHNPLLTRRLTFHLWDRDLIRHEHGRGWVWDEARLGQVDITDDAAAMLASRIDALDETGQRLVRIASLLGTQFDVDMLVELAGRDTLEVMQQLMGLVDEGLIAPRAHGFKFVHDRIREAAQSRITSRERAALHAAAARVLEERTAPGDLPAIVFELADHMLGALELAADEPGACDRGRLLEILHVAGTRGLARGAADTAAYYLDHALALLTPDDWTERFPCASGIHLDAAEAAIQRRRFDHAGVLLTALGARDLPKLLRTQVAAKRIVLASLTDGDDAVDIGLESLRELGVHLAKDPSYLRTRLDMWLTDWRVAGRTGEGFSSGRPISDSAELAPMLIIGACGARIAMHSSRLASAAACFSLRFFKSHAQFGSPALSFAAFASQWITLATDVERALHYARAAEFWMERAQSPARDVRCRIILQGHVYPFSRPRRDCLEPLRRAAEHALELGDLEYAGFAFHHEMTLGFLLGEPVPRSWQRLEALASGAAHFESHNESVVERALELLCGPPPEELDASQQIGELLERMEVGAYRAVSPGVLLAGTLCILGRFADAARTCEMLSARVRRSGGLGGTAPDFLLYRGLASACPHGAVGALRASPLYGDAATLRRTLRRLRHFARTGPDFAHMVTLLEAEALRIRGRARAAVRRYELAARDARRSGYPQHAGFAHERRAELLRDANRQIERQAALREARERYEEWGAPAKVAQLARSLDASLRR